MAGTVTTTEKTHSSIKKVTWTWTSDASGDADGATTAALDGHLIALLTNPDDTDAPTDNYDITITDADGHDVLLGAGANRDTATTEYVTQGSLGAVSDSALTLNVSNSGNAKKGVVVVYLR